MKLQAIADIAEICFQKGITTAILSPGSRCAPLTLAFSRHPGIKCYTISDERCAAFIGLGMADYQRRPAVLICTSGSAALNYAPGIAEAFYRQVPLLVLTADRPPEWVDQWDGQTIRQQGIFGTHVKKSYQAPVALEHADATWHVERLVSEAINLCEQESKGPVHVNIPLREPFYPTPGERYNYSSRLKTISVTQAPPDLDAAQWQEIAEAWQSYDKRLVVAGQHSLDSGIIAPLSNLLQNNKLVIAADVISNLPIENKIAYHDIFLAKGDEKLKESLRPELLITYGLSVISKNLKLFLRTFKPKEHWHISLSGEAGDPFQSLTRIIRTSPEVFFARIALLESRDAFQAQKEENFYKIWQIENGHASQFVKSFFPRQPFGEFEALSCILPGLPEGCHLHLANSMAVRYANLLGLSQKEISVFANRGTSGIDGSNSTAVGTALASGIPTTLITGDMAFFYDRNAFWHNYDVSNLRIILLNNHGGGIFRLINGPSEQPELEEYFETRQPLKAVNTAADFGFEYLYAADNQSLAVALRSFFTDSKRPRLLEIETNGQKNQEIFQQYKTLINKNYEQ